VTLRDWTRETQTRLDEDGLSGVCRSGLELFFGAVRRFDRAVPFGTNVYDRDWDLLVVLDACRADLFAEVAEEYGYEVGDLTSVAGGSRTWMERTFAPDREADTRETLYVTGNPFSAEMVDPARFRAVEEVWRYGWNEELNTVPPRPLTDVTIREHRRLTPKRTVVHYMQPHHPFVPTPMDSGMNRDDIANPEGSVWDRLRRGEVDHDTVWDAYRENLRYVLDDVRLLLRSVDAERVVLTADHGNALGEWGFYGHGDVPFPSVRRVPWSVTSARDDDDEYDPRFEPARDDGDRNQKLRDLGYL
jgi:hypothetical protein